MNVLIQNFYDCYVFVVILYFITVSEKFLEPNMNLMLEMDSSISDGFISAMNI